MLDSFYEFKMRAGNIFSNHLKDGSQGPEMVVIPAGEFRMGDITGNECITGNDKPNEKPVHSVTVKHFAIGRYPVTVSEFRSFVTDREYQTEAEKPKKRGTCVPQDTSKDIWKKQKDANWRDPHFSKTDKHLSQTDNHPVVCISWNDAVAYAEWLSEQTRQQYRLPTEAEWEYAARAGTATDYWWGDQINNDWANYYDNDNNSQWGNILTSPGGSYKANPFGLYDTVGNVWEWCADNWHDDYNGAPTDGAVWNGSNKDRVRRGGSCFNEPNFCRTAKRSHVTPDYRTPDIGFRVALSH